MQETQVQSLGWEDPLQKNMASHLVVSGLSYRLLNPYCGMQNLSVAACGIQFPNQGRNPGPQCGVSASETPGKSSEDLFFSTNQL